MLSPKLLGAALVLTAIPSGTAALAAWVENGVPVCVAANDQQSPALVTDGTGGAIIVWRDKRSDPARIYAQRVDSSGNALWAADGVVVAQLVQPGDPGVIHPPLAVSDGVGGAYIVWSDVPVGPDTQNNVYAQRLRADGTLIWPGRVLVATSIYDDIVAAAISDFRPALVQAPGVIVAFVAWGNGVHLQRLDQSGAQLWGSGGVGPVGPAIYPGTVGLASDRTNTNMLPAGAIVTWDGDGDIHANRVDRSGLVQWGASGVAVCAATGTQSGPSIAAVGPRAAIISWNDSRGLDLDIYAQKVVDAVPAWTSNGLPVCTEAYSQVGPRTVAVADGAFVVWMDQRYLSRTDIYAQRLNATGDPQWPANGIPVDRSTNLVDDAVADGAGGFFVTWQEPNSEIRVQRVGGDGNNLWPADGEIICDATGYRYGQKMLWNGSSLLMSWADHRSGTSYDIYAGQLSGTAQSGVADAQGPASGGLRLQLLSANPLANGEARLAVDLPESAPLGMSVFDAHGRLVWNLPAQERPAGAHALLWNGLDRSGASEPAGFYFLRVTAGNRSGVVKLLWLR